MPADDAWREHRAALGSFIRSQRRLARMSLRDLAAVTDVSNPYLSQIERGMHEPSVRVLRSIARALNLSAETLLAQAGLLEEDADAPPEPDANGERSETVPADTAAPDTMVAIRCDPNLTDAQKEALLGVYRSYLAANQ